MDKTHPDAELIARLGGPAKLARALGYNTKDGKSTQRVNNWRFRGIPEILRYKRPDVFGPIEVPAAADQEGEAA
jgi:hypothetical protein